MAEAGDCGCRHQPSPRLDPGPPCRQPEIGSALTAASATAGSSRSPPSRPTRPRWGPGGLEPGRLAVAGRPRARRRSSPTSTPRRRHLHPDFGSPREYGFPYGVVGAGAANTRPLHRLRRRERPRAVPRPRRTRRSRAGRRTTVTATCSSSTAARASSTSSTAPSRASGRAALERRLRRDLGPGLGRAPPRRLHLGRRRRAADLPRPRPLRRGRRGRDQPRDPGHLESTQDAWIHPASHCAGDTSSPNAPPMGLRLRLKAGYDLAGFSGAAKVIAWRSSATASSSPTTAPTGTSAAPRDRRWNDENLNQLKSIPGSAFEVVRSAALGPPLLAAGSPLGPGAPGPPRPRRSRVRTARGKRGSASGWRGRRGYRRSSAPGRRR